VAASGFGIYIHVPFCRKAKCPYCDFYSVQAEPGLVSEYLKAAELELESAGAGPFGSLSVVETIYFGGGTPSLLAPQDVGRLISKVDSLWTVAREAEISLECNPEDLDFERAVTYRQAGVTRMSVGCQSFDRLTLRSLGRSHSADQSRKAVQFARKAGFESVSADLIFGGPGSSEVSVAGSIETALGLGADHLSIYGYHCDQGSRGFGRKKYEPLGEDLYCSQYLAACSLLESCGWLHYEISSWAGGSQRLCRHNLAYWRRGTAYLGCGPAAHSFWPPDVRIWNREDLEIYLKAPGLPGEPLRLKEELSPDEILAEEVMLGLRLAEGIEPELVERFLGVQTGETIQALSREGLLHSTLAGRLALSDKGFLLYDSIVELLSSPPGVSA